MTQRKLTDEQLQRRIHTEQRVLLRRIAAKHQRIAALQTEVADLHGQLHELPATMVAVRDFGPVRAAYLAHVVPEPPASDDVSTATDTFIPHVEHLRYGYAGVENLCKCTSCLTEKENAS
jgi:hypothetical protein